jgi:hypothetical protein
MFFRRESSREVTFQDRLQKTVEAGFQVEKQGSGRVRIARDGCAAWIDDVVGQRPRVERAGILQGHEIGFLLDAGFQKFWKTPSGRTPATAAQLTALHVFEQDLREALGVESLYNLSLGTENDLHQYDRVKDRDRGVAKRPWE